MRDAFGGVFMIRLFLVFIVIYIAFTAISLNYAKAFRVKNKVIDFVEKNEITDLNAFFASSNGNNITKLDKLLKNANYHQKCKNGNGVIQNDEGQSHGYCYNGIYIKQIETSNNTIYYQVSTSADWNLGALNMILALGGQNKNSEDVLIGNWIITGEAKVKQRIKGE